MPKARAKKNTDFQHEQQRAVFLYGNPNAGKRELILREQKAFTKIVQDSIQLLAADRRFFMELVKNDRKTPAIRAFEKEHRPRGLNSAFCQNAFDTAVTLLSNRLNAIRTEMLKEEDSCIVKSKMLFAMAMTGRSRKELAAAVCALNTKKPGVFYQDCISELSVMSDAEYHVRVLAIEDAYADLCLCCRVPSPSMMPVLVDSRFGKVEASNSTQYPYVAVISDPFARGRKIAIPIRTSSNGVRRFREYGKNSSFLISITPEGNLRVQCSFRKRHLPPDTRTSVGVDTGITDCFHTSGSKAIGSMLPVMGYYKMSVEPSLGGLSALRNKKRSISHYLQTHPALPADVRRSLINKMDRLEHMIQTAGAAFRKRNRYNAMLDREVRDSVRTYLSGIDRQTLTVLEKLDIKEFHKSHAMNGQLSVFARGLLQKTLMDELNWHGYAFTEVVPDYTSQVCPVCSNLDSASRNGKDFTCTCCGYHDDADHVGAVNIVRRASDDEVLKVCDQYQYRHKELQAALRAVYTGRNSQWRSEHPRQDRA